MTADQLTRQHASNAGTWLSQNGFPAFSTFGHQPDRCLVHCDGPFAVRCNAIMDVWDFKIHAHKPIGGDTAVRGWAERGRVRYGAQIVEHFSGETFWELDFDQWRANSGLLGMVGHLLEWVWNKARKCITDAVKVAKARGFPLVERIT